MDDLTWVAKSLADLKLDEYHYGPVSLVRFDLQRKIAVRSWDHQAWNVAADGLKSTIEVCLPTPGMYDSVTFECRKL